MKNFNLSCVSCKNKLAQCGLLLESHLGPLVCCSTCRELYYIDVIVDTEGKPVIIVQPTEFSDEDEFEIIRTALSSVPLSEYLAKETNSEDEEEYYEKNINPHFKKDLKLLVEESVTPSDLIRKLKKEDI